MLTSVTQSELVAIRPESNVELSPESNMIINKRTAQDGSKVATVCTPIIETSMPSGRVIPRSGLTAINPRIDKAIGTIANRIPPNMKDFTSSLFLIANERCQYC